MITEKSHPKAANQNFSTSDNTAKKPSNLSLKKNNMLLINSYQRLIQGEINIITELHPDSKHAA